MSPNLPWNNSDVGDNVVLVSFAARVWEQLSITKYLNVYIMFVNLFKFTKSINITKINYIKIIKTCKKKKKVCYLFKKIVLFSYHTVNRQITYHNKYVWEIIKNSLRT